MNPDLKLNTQYLHPPPDWWWATLAGELTRYSLAPSSFNEISEVVRSTQIYNAVQCPKSNLSYQTDSNFCSIKIDAYACSIYYTVFINYNKS